MDLCKNSKFALGRIVSTKNAMKMLNDKMISPLSFLQRHQSGDWGNICEEDKEQNNLAIEHEGNVEKQKRVMSVYRIGTQTIWIITENNRSVTTLLRPCDY